MFAARRSLLRREFARATRRVLKPCTSQFGRANAGDSRICKPLLRRERQVALRIAVISGALLRRRGLLLVVVVAIPMKFERRVNRGASQL